MEPIIFFYLRKSVKDSLPCAHDEKWRRREIPGSFSKRPLFVRFHQAGVSVGNDYVKFLYQMKNGIYDFKFFLLELGII